MDPVFVNYSSRRLTRRDVATLTAAHIAGVVRALGAEQAKTVLSEFNWPIDSFERISKLTDFTPLITHLEQTRFANITTL
jgi:hypothetical protein